MALWTAVFCLTDTLESSPRLITDNRIENLNGFPSIGRGYNLHSNTLQSMCFSKVTKTKPTFDLDYQMDEVSESFFRQVPEVGKNRMGNINVHFFVKRYYKEEELESQEVHQLKNLLVRVEIRSYYYALDETHSTLSASAKQLLQDEEYVTFFNSCGQHYVRSVGSFSTYLALLQYRLTGKAAVDEAFASQLEKGLFNFSGDNTVGSSFSRDAEVRGMRVYVQAVGLSKGNMVNLVPVDINQFRLTVQDTVKLMQDSDAGIISYMEVVPWVENPELTSFLKAGKDDGGEQFIKLQRLEANSGVITEINRMSNSQVEQFYIASMCEKILFENYMDKSNRHFYENITGQTDRSPTILFLTDIIDQKVLSYDMEQTLFFNLANVTKEKVYISLREFIEYFAKNPPRKLFDENKTYLYGDGTDPGAIQCIDKLYSGGLTEIDYRTIPSCVKALKHIQTQSFFLSQYCLPKPAKLVFTGDSISDKMESMQQESIRSRIVEPPEPEPEPVIRSIKGEKPKSLEELFGEREQRLMKEEEASPPEKDEIPTSLGDLMDERSEDIPRQTLEEGLNEEVSPMIQQELAEGEAEARKQVKPEVETEEEQPEVTVEEEKAAAVETEAMVPQEADSPLIDLPDDEESQSIRIYQIIQDNFNRNPGITNPEILEVEPEGVISVDDETILQPE